MTVAYLAHPVSGLSRADLVTAMNGWIELLCRRFPDNAFCAPWLPYVLALDDDNPERRARGTRDDLTILARCDAVWLLGDRISSGMLAEAKEAARLKLAIKRLRIIDGGLLVTGPPTEVYY